VPPKKKFKKKKKKNKEKERKTLKNLVQRIRIASCNFSSGESSLKIIGITAGPGGQRAWEKELHHARRR
jgi:stalled ribosome rescue protein Dom34